MFKTIVIVLLVLSIVDQGFSYERYATKILNGNPNDVTIDPSPFIKIGEGYYYFSQDQTNWHIAYENCRKMGSDLVSLETDEEYDAVIGYLQSKGDRSYYWTSGNDLGETGTFNWFPTAQPVSISRWAPGQPDNSGGIEHCIHLGYQYSTSTDIQMNDRPCRDERLDSLFNYACEAPKQETISIVVWK